MTWGMIWESLKGSMMFTPLFMCVMFCGLMLFIGIREYGWMVLVKVVAIVVFMTVVAAGVRLFFDWVFQWGAVK